MRRLLMSVAGVCVFGAGALAQTTDLPMRKSTEAAGGECHAVSPTDHVVVSTVGSTTVRGTLMCMSDTRVWLLRDGGMASIELDRVRRIRTPADPVWDGALRGAVPPLLIWALLCREHCPAEPFLRMSLTFGLAGLVGDAVQTNRRTLYRAPPSFRVGWKLRF